MDTTRLKLSIYFEYVLNNTIFYLEQENIELSEIILAMFATYIQEHIVLS